ncbi:MAG: DUF1289 domain-containing protein [Alphaproteobacteria bacterium]
MAKLPDLPSPCIGVCAIDVTTGLCAGCMRTPTEIALWGGSDNEKRYEILQELKKRRRAAGQTSPADMRARRRARRSAAE